MGIWNITINPFGASFIYRNFFRLVERSKEEGGGECVVCVCERGRSFDKAACYIKFTTANQVHEIECVSILSVVVVVHR